jgi:magnesium-protoporphyrin O-methyltransferase
LQDASLLDVGGGIGVIDMELAESGVTAATVVEAAPAYFEVARSAVEACYGSRPTQFVVGDFAAVSPTLSDADVVTLDRVVCCYPKVEDLLRAAAQRTRRLIAYTYPRNRWYVRAFMAFNNSWRRLRGNPFRSFLHSPERMRAVLEAAGLVHAARHGTAVWMVELYSR